MKRNEAIEDLKTLKEYFEKESCATPICIEYAIKALSVQTDADLISRSEAIKKISEWATNIINPKLLLKEDVIYVLETLQCEDCEHWYDTEDDCADRHGCDLISRADVHKVLSTLSTEGGKDAKMLFMDAHEWIDDMPSVSAERPIKVRNDGTLFVNVFDNTIVDKVVVKDGVHSEYTYYLPTPPSERVGEWIAEVGYEGEVLYYECSNCKEAFSLLEGTPEENKYNYCPNCGADMRGDPE